MTRPTSDGQAVLVGTDTGRRAAWSAESSLDELARLADTAGVLVAERLLQRRSDPDPLTYVGKGKLEELRAELAQRPELGLAIFDDELSPAQQRNIERILGEQVRVVDRTTLILDIFAQHAHSREGQIQVELAQYEYLQPRLAGMWRHLIRQAGGRAGGAIGVGLRGPGETQLENDRRVIRRRITALRRELEEVRTSRRQHYRQRARRELKTVALVGYTNAGKSSLLNALFTADAGRSPQPGASERSEPPRAYVADQLFATLDPTTRRVRLPSGTQVLFTDTVGFINKLPTHLVAAFRATLEGIEEADLLLHVADVAHPEVDAQVRTVGQVLAELGLADKPILQVWNKIDRVPELAVAPPVARDGSVRVSALTGAGIPRLLQAVEQALKQTLVAVDVRIPYTRGDLKSRIFAHGSVEWYREDEGGTLIRAFVPAGLAETLEEFRR
ncbi:MAG: GTPase HflX [Spirochaetales bacterium]|nr:GTPase HflX [Spirochaetales bacterium]